MLSIDSHKSRPLGVVLLLIAVGGGGEGVSAAPPPAFAGATVVDDAGLKLITGKADLSQSVLANNTSTVSNNSVNGDSTTGPITFAGGAFQELHGLAVVSANTGNNVSINTSMNVAVAIRP